MFRLVGFIGKDKVFVEWIESGLQEVVKYENGCVVFD